MNQGGYGKIKYGKTWIFSYLTVPVSDENSYYTASMGLVTLYKH